MTTEDTHRQFWKIFCRVLDIPDPGGCVTARDCENWDSLRHVELVFALEDAFDVEVSPEDVVNLYSTTDEVLAYLERRLPPS